MIDLLTAQNIGRFVVLVAVAAATSWVTQWARPAPEPQVRTDTTYVERTLIRRDTVTETRPVERTIYERDTTIKRDTIYIRKPSTFTPASCVGKHPLDVDGREATLTRWDLSTQRWVQDTYRFERPDWRIDIHGALTASLDYASGNSTLGLAHRTPVGWLRVGAGYGAAAMGRARVGPVATVSLRKTIWTDE